MTLPKKKETVIQDVIVAVETGAFVSSTHAEKRMAERDIDFSDIEEAIYRAIREEDKDTPTDDGTDWKYVLRGLNDNGDKDIRIVVVYLDNPKMLMITVIDKYK